MNDPSKAIDQAMEVSFNHVQSGRGHPIVGGAGLFTTLQEQQELEVLKQSHELQQQLLLQQYKAQCQELAIQQEAQWRDRLQAQHQLILEAEEQQKLEQEQMVKDVENKKLERIKNKEKCQESAVASTEVKQRLQEFVLNRKQRESSGITAQRSWEQEHSPTRSMGFSPPYRHPLLNRFDEDFPLRKTSSEPNLKVRSILKHKVIERRSSPLLARRKPILHAKRKTPMAFDSNGSNPDSEPGSPPLSVAGVVGGSPTTDGSALIGVLNEDRVGALPLDVPKNPTGTQLLPNDIQLYTSPSLPNISLGRPQNSSTAPSDINAEAERRAIATARYGLPLTSHVIPSSWAYYPSLPEGDITPPGSPVYTQLSPPILHPCGYGESPTLKAQLQRSGLKPLSRTHSAPLPLQHPLLQHQQQNVFIQPHQHEQYLQEKALYEKQQMLKRLHIRQAILSKSSNKKQQQAVSENLDEEEAPANVSEIPHVLGEGGADLLAQQELVTTLQQQRELIRLKYGHDVPIPKPVTRAFSSPIAAFNIPTSSSVQESSTVYKYTTGLGYDSLMLKHQCTCGNFYVHPEHGGRLQNIWQRIQDTGLAMRCERIRSRKATLEEIQTCHSEAHTLLFGTNPLNRQKIDPEKLAELPIKSFAIMPCGGLGVDSDTVWNELHTGAVARMAVGTVIELSMKVATGEIKNGYAIVRPPGHHAEIQQAMGFCFFNNVAIAAKLLQQRLQLEKILIVDWDVHHGNGTQQITYNDPHILYISLHRHDDGGFFPGTGACEETGIDDGIGFNVNIAFSGALNPPMADAEYLAAFRTVVMPIAHEFDPDIVLVSCGFDACVGHPPQLGGYLLSPNFYGYMTKQLMTLAHGKVILVLEGGYDLPSICDASEECLRVLLGEEPAGIKESELTRHPNKLCIDALQKVISIQAPHWPSVKRLANTINNSFYEVRGREMEEADTVSALASLSMVTVKRTPSPISKQNMSVELPIEESMEEEVQIISSNLTNFK